MNSRTDTLDNLTHALVGAALSRTGLCRATPLATATLVVAANAPDIDVLSYVRGEYFALSFRRGITHGLPALVVLPFVVAGAMLAWDRWVRRRRKPHAPAALPLQILLLAFLGVLTHPILDWMNVYGMRWALPFNGAWSYGDALFIIDPWLWLLLGGAALLGGGGGRVVWGVLVGLTTLLVTLGPVPGTARWFWLAGLLAVAVLRFRTHAGPDARGRGLARAGLASAVVYIGLMMVGSTLGERQVMDAARAAGAEGTSVLISPSAADPFTAEVEVVTPDGYVPGTLQWFRNPRVVLRPGDKVLLLDRPGDLDPDAASSILARAEQDPDVASYLVWSRYPYTVVERRGEGWSVRYSDARYDGREGAGGLGGVTVWVPAG